MLEADIRHEATCARARGRQGVGPLSLVLMKYAVREVSACRLPLLSSVCLLLRVPLARVPCLCPCEIWLCWSCPLSLSLCWSCVSRVNSLVSCACGLCGAASLLLVACLCVCPLLHVFSSIFRSTPMSWCMRLLRVLFSLRVLRRLACACVLSAFCA